MHRYIFIFFLILLIGIQPVIASSKLHKEAVYQTKWCDAMCGISEYQLNDKTRVDCLTKTHAIEFDFAEKVYEGIGQSLYYSIKTQKKPGIVLIVEQPQKEEKYINRMKQVADNNGIDCWLMYESDLDNFQIRPLIK